MLRPEYALLKSVYVERRATVGGIGASCTNLFRRWCGYSEYDHSGSKHFRSRASPSGRYCWRFRRNKSSLEELVAKAVTQPFIGNFPTRQIYANADLAIERWCDDLGTLLYGVGHNRDRIGRITLV